MNWNRVTVLAMYSTKNTVLCSMLIYDYCQNYHKYRIANVLLEKPCIIYLIFFFTARELEIIHIQVTQPKHTYLLIEL